MGFMRFVCGEGGEGTLGLSRFNFNMLGAAGWDGAPNFPPHDLVTIDGKSNQMEWEISYQEDVLKINAFVVNSLGNFAL
jgi:hypothetical protein